MNPLEAALANPWAALRAAIDDPLHPGGEAATRDLLDRAGVTAGTRLLDAGCGAGESLALAADRGARPVGLDRDPGLDGGTVAANVPVVRGDLRSFPVRDDALDVVLAECTLCLSDDVGRTLTEARRALGPDGRLALSDVVTNGEAPDLPPFVASALCLAGGADRDRDRLLRRVRETGFAVRAVHDHREDLLAMRDQVTEQVDVDGLLSLAGERADDLRQQGSELQHKVENGELGYVSLVAEVS
ncbi:MAG: class I SAM-dependent methyltransferase [Haloglomus sp.]